jgi:hypothetical protein
MIIYIKKKVSDNKKKIATTNKRNEHLSILWKDTL